MSILKYFQKKTVKRRHDDDCSTNILCERDDDTSEEVEPTSSVDCVSKKNCTESEERDEESIVSSMTSSFSSTSVSYTHLTLPTIYSV